MTTATRSAALVLLASEAIWPNLHSLAHWIEPTGLSAKRPDGVGD